MEEVRGGELASDPAAEAVRPAVRAVLAELAADPAVTGSGAHLEDKGISAAVHWRRVADRDRWAGPLAAAARAAAARHGLRPEPGKLVVELRPAIRADKGTAVAKVAADAGAELVVVAGDDRGDLAAFRAVEELAAAGRDGLRVAVASAEAPAELLDRADLVVAGPEGLRDLLAGWAAG